MNTRVSILAAVLLFALATWQVPAVIAADSGEAIGVSGHWVIEVRDPDGGMAARREFHNALDPSSNALGQLLTAQMSAGGLQIRAECSLGSVGCVTPCPRINPAANPACQIIDPRQTIPEAGGVFRNLATVEIVGGVQLRGFFVAATEGTIGFVSTLVRGCVRTAAPAACTVNQVVFLTSGLVSPPVVVQAGQQVLVTVNLTFATATPAPAAAAPSVSPR